MQTADKIIYATTSLLKNHGYRGVTTKAIAAEAQVNETTIFRHFGSKQGILEAIVDRFSYLPQFEKLLKEDAADNPRIDLMKVCENYLSFFRQNADIILIGFRDKGLLPKLDQKLSELPLHLHALLTEYFERLKQKDIIVVEDSDLTAMSFLSMCYGFQMGMLMHGASAQVEERKFYEHSVELFIRGLAFKG
ncbi:TetR/AcrR family transcriptional regulator [Paenibacillus senegalensis]|uniref:TetR/AcrR family transcriptional regulator n=1 Tax=Paenibacillus senegalensis TaxID=1465766 RepID=UPI00028A3E85|nr:TetR/AcrR family transcriptional regulator [Paenibacillus senegalensis]